ncbi:MAG: hypothetical protein AAB393_03360, partial [Bacteroidota bacterium]
MEDVHFYIDNAPPGEVEWVLRCLHASDPMTTQMIAERLSTEFGVAMQKDKTYSPRRLFDLGLSDQGTSDAKKKAYTLTALGQRVRELLALDNELYPDLMHYLHYSSYDAKPGSRKFLWSYRHCCNSVWSERRLIDKGEMASRILGWMKQEFPKLDYGARVGARFDGTAVGRCYAWVQQLQPAPFSNADNSLMPRITQRYELALLALDDVYRTRGYGYGDPVVLDAQFLDDVSRVFF